MKQQKTQDDTYLSANEYNYKSQGIGQLRRAKMHLSCLLKDIDKNALTPALYELMEASITLHTTSTKILAAYLKRSPANIRTEFQKILAILGERKSHSLLA